jgi:1-deoxyxylulose-5-phosphate synthase
VYDALERLADRAAEHGVSMAALALAWLLHTPEISAVVVGPNTVAQLAPVEEALTVDLSSDEHHELAGWFA